MKLRSLIMVMAVAMVAKGSMAASFPNNSDDKPVTKEVVVRVNDAYVPSGFDSNMDSFVVVNGLFPNSCYQWKEALVAHSTDRNQHQIRAIATVRQGMCLMVLIPFTKEVSLGKLKSGDHTVRFENGDGTYFEKTIHVD